MGRKKCSNQLPADTFRRAIGENQRKKQKDVVSNIRTSVDQKKGNQEFGDLVWAFCMALTFGMMISVFVIAGMKYFYGMPTNVPWRTEL